MKPTIDTQEQVNIRAAQFEIDLWRDAAKRDGRTLSNWIRWRLNLAASEKETDIDQNNS